MLSRFLLVAATLVVAAPGRAQSSADTAAVYRRAAEAAPRSGAQRVAVLQGYGPMSATARTAVAEGARLPGSGGSVRDALPHCTRSPMPDWVERGMDLVPGPVHIAGSLAFVRVGRACRTWEDGRSYYWVRETWVAEVRLAARWWRAASWTADERLAPLDYRQHYEDPGRRLTPMTEEWMGTAVPFLVVLLLVVVWAGYRQAREAAAIPPAERSSRDRALLRWRERLAELYARWVVEWRPGMREGVRAASRSAADTLRRANVAASHLDATLQALPAPAPRETMRDRVRVAWWVGALTLLGAAWVASLSEDSNWRLLALICYVIFGLPVTGAIGLLHAGAMTLLPWRGPLASIGYGTLLGVGTAVVCRASFGIAPPMALAVAVGALFGGIMTIVPVTPPRDAEHPSLELPSRERAG